MSDLTSSLFRDSCNPCISSCSEPSSTDRRNILLACPQNPNLRSRDVLEFKFENCGLPPVSSCDQSRLIQFEKEMSRSNTSMTTKPASFP